MLVLMGVVVGAVVRVRVCVHSSVFYVVPHRDAACSACSIVGWLTTRSREFIDDLTSRCHYQKRYSRARYALSQGVTRR